MRYTFFLPLTIATMLAAAPALSAADVEPGFTTLFDGKTYDGWKMVEENQANWTIEDGALVSHGKRCHLFYVGEPTPFKNFTLRVDVMTDPGAKRSLLWLKEPRRGLSFHPILPPSIFRP